MINIGSTVGSTKLRIVWDGQAAGLAEGRLSLVEFGDALNALMRAMRNIARRHLAALISVPSVSSRRSRAPGVPCSAHVPRTGLRPALLLYFAAQRTPAARSGTARRAPPLRTPDRWQAKDVGYRAQRSKGGGSGEAGPGGHERSPVPGGLGPQQRTERTSDPGRFQPDNEQRYPCRILGLIKP